MTKDDSEKPRKHVLYHNGFTLKRRKKYSQVVMFKPGTPNPEYRRKTIRATWHKEEE
jgi:hypothetical protein|tara:strand:+ start:198 stop:368 length:171 start_codon:yes stop_codon:yes gene_type:complete